MNADVRAWARACLACQRSKIDCHTISPSSRFVPPDARLDQVHTDLVGPLPPANSSLGTHHIQTTAYHPAANGLVERLHRQLKVSLYATDHADTTWPERLPFVLLGFRAAIQQDNCSVAHMVYGCPLRLPRAFFTPSAPLVPDTSSYIDCLRQLFQDRKPTPSRSGPATGVFVSPTLHQATHAFVCWDSVRTSLQPPYGGPHRVISRAGKFFRLDLPQGPDTVAIDRLKPALLESAPLVSPEPPSLRPRSLPVSGLSPPSRRTGLDGIPRTSMVILGYTIRISPWSTYEERRNQIFDCVTVPSFRVLG
ncbi:uncharacterized protein LOC135384539 [Ornithodoros turicata]|uniref:uncharacterized protein LOC135384539 n=1 Tax=Ornithodoros turicata TaxID=34597 RepID=UPI00313954EE